MTDFLEARSMNLNVRVSPMMKMQLTERVKKLGINITDYIYVAIAKSESMESNVETLNTEKLKLQQQVRQLQNQIKRYEDMVEPLVDLIGKEITTSNNDRIVLKDKFEILNLIVSSFKTKEK